MNHSTRLEWYQEVPVGVWAPEGAQGAGAFSDGQSVSRRVAERIGRSRGAVSLEQLHAWHNSEVEGSKSQDSRRTMK